MFALGHSRTNSHGPKSSNVRYAPKADNRGRGRFVREVPIADVAYALETRFLRCHQKTAVLLYSQQHDKPTPPFGRKTDRFLASARCNSNNCRASIRARERSLGGAEVARADHRTYSLGSFVSCYCMDPKDSPEGFNRVAVGSARPR
jgi:hypothetical protein